MRLLESLRQWSHERHHRRVNLPYYHSFQATIDALRQSVFLNNVWRLMETLSDSFSTAPSRHAMRLNAYIWPRSNPWPPYSPSPALAQRLHRYAAVHIFTAIYLPYAFIVSVVTMIVAIGLRVGFPNGWRFSVVLGICGWIPTTMLVGIYVVLKMKIKDAREIAWGAWAAAVDRRILEFESLHGRARAEEITAFVDWVRAGEGLDGAAFVEREPDEESAIGPALTDEEYETGWGSFSQVDGGDGSDDPNDEGWNMHGTVLRDLHMAVHWRQNADEQERAHREAQEVARLGSHVANPVAAETSSRVGSAVKETQESLLDIDVGDDEPAVLSTGKDDNKGEICEENNMEMEQDDNNKILVDNPT